jgi:hypothetical protein
MTDGPSIAKDDKQAGDTEKYSEREGAIGHRLDEDY